MFRIACLSFLLLISSSAAYADTVLITNGTMSLQYNGFVQVNMNISSSNASAVMSMHSFGNIPCSICSSGQTINLSGHSGTIGPFDAGGTIVFEGTQYTIIQQLLPPALPFIIVTGGVGLNGGSVTVPFSSDPFITLTAPFTVLGGFAAIGGPFSMEFQGSGMATVVLSNIGQGGLGQTNYQFQSATYTFQTPEPATVVLLATGLTGGFLRYRRRRR